MFVPLPVPFVFQRTAPDLSAWRLKSPLALRSNSGKTFYCYYLLNFTALCSFLVLLVLHLLHVGQPCRPAPMRLQNEELSAHTHTHFTHALPTFSSFLPDSFAPFI
ncbi:hypothetical protein GOODEAATRI_001008 [Goodea atripinnis]|uniref:Uncharacterized protein n=1 Tax=Goodea atripinnis TaxID=208336 RepID=A0ABV0MNB5_9TELE